MCPSYHNKRDWLTVFAVVVWTVWEERNQSIFKREEIDFGKTEDLIKFRTAWWFKHLKGGSLDPVTTLLQNLKDLYVDHSNVRAPKLASKMDLLFHE